jgi:hypothetical protein
VRDEVMRANRRRYGTLRPSWTDCDDAVRGTVSAVVEHCAVMLAVATATGREAGVRILGEREHRRNQGKREGREQQDGQQASHKKIRQFKCTASLAGECAVLGILLKFGQIRRGCGLS